ncbi:hypothetical protein [Methylobacterium soli]|uniref:Uncharacterized protein n=1 Tax=Methylobacterium soli TaxID=553447 RepID=A0A6L3SRF0_9HYPH|nr:hypothetical protein [Methylobacterium soli]KAB1074955.1 hypothetical protein F6X53_25195 [Methylobacterium soli]
MTILPPLQDATSDDPFPAAGLAPAGEPLGAPEACPLVQRLIAILAEDQSDSPRRQDEILLKLLLALEMEAEDAGAPDASLRVIARVRRLAGTAACRSVPRPGAP